MPFKIRHPEARAERASKGDGPDASPSRPGILRGPPQSRLAPQDDGSTALQDAYWNNPRISFAPCSLLSRSITASVCGDQLLDHLAAPGDRVALIAAALEEIRGRHLRTHRLRHRNHVKAVAVAGEVHHLQFGRGQRAVDTPRPRKHDGIEQLLGLQQRADIDIEIERVQPEAFRRAAKLYMIAPLHRHGACMRDHALQHLDLALQLFLLLAGKLRRARLQRLRKSFALLGQQACGVGGQQLIVAKRGRCRLGAGSLRFQPGLHIVFAGAAGFETIDRAQSALW